MEQDDGNISSERYVLYIGAVATKLGSNGGHLPYVTQWWFFLCFYTGMSTFSDHMTWYVITLQYTGKKADLQLLGSHCRNGCLVLH